VAYGFASEERVDYLHKKVESGLRQSGYALVPVSDNGQLRRSEQPVGIDIEKSGGD
jgi:hypothetical protein